jgi:type IV secretory pathway TrbD component
VTPPRTRPEPSFDEDEPEEAPGYLHTALVTTAWYTIPLLLYTMYVLTLDGSAEAGDGVSARANALNGLLGGMPRVGVALATSLAVALLIRVISRGWRAATIGFASAVVGAGVATVIFTALQG